MPLFDKSLKFYDSVYSELRALICEHAKLTSCLNMAVCIGLRLYTLESLN